MTNNAGNNAGQGGHKGVVAIALGAHHGLALTDRGHVVTWGEAHETPLGLSGVTAIAAGRRHSLALASGGTVVAWGHNDKGQTDVPAGLTGVTAIAAGLAHNLALRNDGTVVAWGFNDAGQSTVPVGLTDVVAVAAGWWHSLALRRDGRVVAWGHPDSDQRHVPYGLSGVVGIAAGYENSSAVLSDGTVIDLGTDTSFLSIPEGQFSAVAYGRWHRLLLRRDGRVVSDGGYGGGVVIPEDLTGVVEIAANEADFGSNFLVLKDDGTVAGFGLAGKSRPDAALAIPVELMSISPADRQAPDGWEHYRSVIGEDAIQDGKTPLMHCAAVGDAEQVEALLKQGADIYAVDHDGDGVLRYLITSMDVQILERLLESGADPNGVSTSASGHRGFRILHAFAEAGWEEGVRTLAAHGADVNARDVGGITPLMLAAGAGENLCISELYKQGANINAVDGTWDSVLYYAASKGQLSSVCTLLALGANARVRSGAVGLSPLAIAAQLASPGARRPPEVPASDYAAIVVELLRSGADPRGMYNQGLVLQRVNERGGLEIAPLEAVHHLVSLYDYWSVIFSSAEAKGNSRTDPPKGPVASGVPTESERHPSALLPAAVSIAVLALIIAYALAS